MRISRLALLFLLPCLAPAQVAILRIQVVEGEGAVHPPGSASARPLTVEVTDETGKPVDHAAVSFHLPDDGPGGAFAGGLRTDVALTDAFGRVSLRSVQWNRAAGRFQIRIVASREQARAGTVSFQYIGDSGSRLRPSAPSARGPSRGPSKWLIVAAIVAGGATAGVVNASRSKTAPSTAAPATLTIGSPTITVGKP